jgi:hypothetical protein
MDRRTVAIVNREARGRPRTAILCPAAYRVKVLHGLSGIILGEDGARTASSGVTGRGLAAKSTMS